MCSFIILYDKYISHSEKRHQFILSWNLVKKEPQGIRLIETSVCTTFFFVFGSSKILTFIGSKVKLFNFFVSVATLNSRKIRKNESVKIGNAFLS
jgi:hypothetical protein